MRINFKKIKTLTVKTASGAVLGHVHDVIIDIESHIVAQYEVGPSLLHRQTYLINREQVLRITDHEMVVDDSAANLVKKNLPLDTLPVTPNPIVMREKSS